MNDAGYATHKREALKVFSGTNGDVVLLSVASLASLSGTPIFRLENANLVLLSPGGHLDEIKRIIMSHIAFLPLAAFPIKFRNRNSNYIAGELQHGHVALDADAQWDP